MKYDLVIRNGTVIDGTGKQGTRADVAIAADRIAYVGEDADAGVEEIDADGLLLTPGFVDIHTHYDGQATWSDRLSPSSDHGVTTVVVGNCGVGFAPCRPDDREDLIRLMEGVEDIPGAVMADGLPWQWETFPQFMEFLATRQYDVDIGAYLPHAPLRVYVMGQRGLDREPANTTDMGRMEELTAEAIRAGALGVSTSRSLYHRSSDQHLLPGVSAAEGELVALSRGVKLGGIGLVQCISDFNEPESDFDMLCRVVRRSGVPLSYSLLQWPHVPDRWRHVLDMTERANRDGLWMKGQVFPRPIGMVLGLQFKWNCFSLCPSYRALADLPLAAKLRVLQQTQTRQRLVSEFSQPSTDPLAALLCNLNNVFVMEGEPNYEPLPADSIAARAEKHLVSPVEYAYDLLIEAGGSQVFYVPALNYAAGNLNAVAVMLNHQDTLVGLGDGGAHVGVVCDASATTYMLKRWTGEGGDGRLPLHRVVHMLSCRNARAMNLLDRGVIAAHYRADINLLDLQRIGLERPTLVHDLPSGAGRLHQAARGYVATIVAGQVTYRDGKATGRLPGRLVRGAQAAPAALSS